MKLEHSFTVPAAVDQVWSTLLDLEEVVACLPGVTLTGRDADAFSGTVTVRLGRAPLTYSGKGRFVERDDDAHRAVIEAGGRERNGNGTASVTVHARLEADGARSTRVLLVSDLTVTGRPAQSGDDVLRDTGTRLVDRFAGGLADRLAGPDAEPPRRARPRPAAPRPAALRPVTEHGPTGIGGGRELAGLPDGSVDAPDEPEREPAGPPALAVLARRLAPVVLVAGASGVLGWWLARWLLRRRR